MKQSYARRPTRSRAITTERFTAIDCRTEAPTQAKSLYQSLSWYPFRAFARAPACTRTDITDKRRALTISDPTTRRRRTGHSYPWKEKKQHQREANKRTSAEPCQLRTTLASAIQNRLPASPWTTDPSSVPPNSISGCRFLLYRTLSAILSHSLSLSRSLFSDSYS